MESLKRKFPDTCPDCNNTVALYQINFDAAIEICNNVKRSFPFNRSCSDGLIHEIPVRYNKKIKTRSSSMANTVAASTASDKLPLKKPGVAIKPNKSPKRVLIELVADKNILKNITQTPVKQNIPSLPANIALPPMSAASQSKITVSTSSNFAIDDIESFLSDNSSINSSTPTNATDCTSPSSVATPKDPTNLSWMNDMDALFGVDMAQTKCNPFQKDDELDSFLGI